MRFFSGKGAVSSPSAVRCVFESVQVALTRRRIQNQTTTKKLTLMSTLKKTDTRMATRIPKGKTNLATEKPLQANNLQGFGCNNEADTKKSSLLDDLENFSELLLTRIGNCALI